MTASGTYQEILTCAVGCDSVITLDLTVLPTNSESIVDEICDGDSYDFHGSLLTLVGTYLDTVIGSNGCDSIVTLELTVRPIEASSLDREICQGAAITSTAIWSIRPGSI